ncbi:penicillin-binding protein activator [Sphingorhabdus sp.]|uniref:penicillin-binding protein activator n=1 Tax=Sphingorhabdus sp. TaxID=1902408 RepID=UPI003C71F66E
MSMIIAASGAWPQHGTRAENKYRATLSRVLAAGLLLFLAACQSVVPKGQGPEGPPPVVSPDPGNVIAADGDRHRVALLLPVTGPDGDVGQSIANATTLALLDTRNTNIRMTTYDTALGIDAAVRKAVADGNRLILGPLRSDDVVAVANVARPAGVPIISFSNDIGAAGSNVFVMGHLPNQSIDRVVRYARGKGMTRFGGVVPKNVYGQRALSNLTKSVRDAGGTLVSIQEIDGTSMSIDAATKKLGAVDAVLIADSGRVAIATIPALRKNGNGGAKVLGTDLWNTDGAISSNPLMQGAWFASVSDTLYSSYASKYRARFGKGPMRLSSLGYVSVLLVARVAQTWKLGTRFPVDRLVDPEGFIGIDGAFRFFPNGVSDRMIEVQEVQQGKFVTIDAAPKNFLGK